MIVIIDYGLGNLGSIQNMLKKIGVPSLISGEADQIYKASKLILPGVGSFDNGMRNIHERGLLKVLDKAVIEDKKPVLGICLGMQLLTKSSEEGIMEGLSWIDAKTIKFNFPDSQKLRIPHMGWNNVKTAKNHPLLNEMEEESRFYFVHSYYVKCADEKDVLMYCDYGIDFACAVQRDNIIGVQFHPEKSHKFGLKLMKAFAEL
jgi:glutamine amidotransferase